MSNFIVPQDKTLNVLTTFKVIQPTIEWSIDRFSKYNDGGCIQSPTFISQDQMYSWYLKLQQNSGTIDITLYNGNYGSCYSLPQSCKFSIAFLNSKRNKVKVFVGQYNSNNGGKWSKNEILNKENDIRVNDSVTILCEINLPNNNNTVHEILKTPYCSVGKCKENIMDKLVEDCSKIMNFSNFSDVTLLVGLKEFKVHKVILAARSPVFAAMFNNEMEEAVTHVVKISDKSPSVMQEVISFIYNGRSPNLKDLAEEVLIAADYYDLVGLKEMCEIEMLSQVNVENALKFLALADTFNLSALREKIVDYVSKNMQEVFKSRYWNEIVNSKPPII